MRDRTAYQAEYYQRRKGDPTFEAVRAASVRRYLDSDFGKQQTRKRNAQARAKKKNQHT